MTQLWRPWMKFPLGLWPVVLLALATVGILIGAKVNSGETGSANVAVKASGDANGTSSKAVLKAYSCNGTSADAVAGRLEQQYPPSAGVRIVADPRASQVLVIAPPDIHAQVEQQLKQQPTTEAPATVAAQAKSPPPVASGPTTRQDLQLWNISGRELEAALLRTLGQRLVPAANSTAENSAYRLTLPSGEELSIAIDRQKNRALVQGSGVAVGSATQLIHALDLAQKSGQGQVGFCMLNKARKADVATVATALQGNSGTPNTEAPAPAGPPPAGPPPDTAQPAMPHAPDAPAANGEDQEGLVGPVQIQILDGLDVLVIRGHQRDVRRVMEVIQQIEQLSTETKPTILVLPLAHVDSVSLGGLLRQVYAEAFATRLGSLSITALGRPNAILLIGRAEPVEMAADLARRLDQPVAPNSQFQVFHLKNIPAQSAQENIATFFGQQQGTAQTQAQRQNQQQSGTDTGSLAARIQIVADFRSNSLIVRGNPRDLAEVAAMIERLDGVTNAAISQVRVFRLKNSTSETLAPVLQDAITGQIYGQRNNRNQLSMQAAVGGSQRQEFERKSTRLQFITVDPRGQRVLNSGILTDVQVTADTRTNAIVVTASAESMPLIAALIEELDQPAEAEAQVKVFTLINSDATAMTTMFQQIFSQADATEGIAVRTGIALDQTSLVGLKFAVDVRTNSVIVTGSTGALTVVEAILMRLDASDVRNRRTSVYRLKNSPSDGVAEAINQYLTNERQAQDRQQGLLSAVEEIEREVVVVSEPVSNSLIISATPRYFDEIMKVIREIDMRPPMVSIQVVIAEVALSDTEEFGVELGLQDKVLFDRSSIISGTNGSTLFPGFNFNSQSIGNSSSAASLATANTVGGQSITNLGMGRTNSDLGFGGLVLSASSDSVSLLVRALQQDHRLQVLSRPQVMTLDNQTAQILVGQKVPTISNSQLTQFGTINTVVYQDVGLMVQVTPRVSPDRLVVMEILAEKSKLEPTATGIPIAISQTGETIRSPIIDTTTTRTVVSALDGQTVVLGGMITKTTEHLQNKVPCLGDIPVLGHLFKYKRDSEVRTELLIIMTPKVVTTPQDAEAIRRAESARMHWCLCDVMAMHDGDGLGKNGPTWFDGDAAVIYPDLDPTLKTMQDLVPQRDGMSPPSTPELVPTPGAAGPANGAGVSGPMPPGPAQAMPRAGVAPGHGAPAGASPNGTNRSQAPPSTASPNDGAAMPPVAAGVTTQVRILPRSQTAAAAQANPAPQETWGQLQPLGGPGLQPANGPAMANASYASPAPQMPMPANSQPSTYVRYANPSYTAPAVPATNR